MNKSLYIITTLLLFVLSLNIQAQQLSPEDKAMQAATDMQKRLGFKESQILQIYTLNLTKIKQARSAKNEKASDLKKLDRHYQAISEAYNLRLRSILTPEQYQRWEILKDEAQERRKIIQTIALVNNASTIIEGLIDPETEFEQLVTQ